MRSLLFTCDDRTVCHCETDKVSRGNPLRLCQAGDCFTKSTLSPELNCTVEVFAMTLLRPVVAMSSVTPQQVTGIIKLDEYKFVDNIT